MFIFSLISFLAWTDLSINQTYTTHSPLKIEIKNQNDFILPEKTNIQLITIDDLGMINVRLFTGTLTPCSEELSSVKSDMTIINDQFGVLISPNCKIEIFVENKDLSTESPFTLN